MDARRQNVTEMGVLEASADDLPLDAGAAPAHAARMTAMGQLIASITHEVNQPLAVIVTSAESCLFWLDSEQPDLVRVRQAAECIVKCGHHASAVVSAVRSLLRKPAPSMSRLNLNNIIEDVLDLVRCELSRYEVALEIDLCHDIGSVMGDGVQLRQVVLNLISNGIESLKQTAASTRLLRMSTSITAGGSVLVAVEDSGTGIDSAVLTRIFEPFFTTKRDGMGVGLSICRSIVEAHGGRLWATSREPRGCVFNFTLCPTAVPVGTQASISEAS
jgi:C4-dicarboxylate-specific signal transduction histidine kinase